MKNPSHEEIKTILKDSKRIAVVGLSNNPNRTSYKVTEAIIDAGYQIIPVNPTIDEVFGVKAVSSLSEIDGEIDIVNVFRKSEFLPEVAEEAAKTNASVFWAQLGLENEEAYQIASKAGQTVIMDRCIKVEIALSRN